ncbi:MAG: hypothetical protein F6K28_46395 [Microcoleus sp. SIO2G3]|nr:hypothetical protein [Microcoleus sp. SIO2G3]
MPRRMLCNQTLDSSIYLNLSEQEAETIQGGKDKQSQDIPKLQALPSPVRALVLLFANPFS